MELKWKYVSPTSMENIEMVEKENDYVYPAGLKEIILDGNNGYVTPNKFKTPSGINQIKTLLSYNREDKENVYRAIKVLKEDGSNLLPFANTPSGDLLCTDGTNIVLWEHETSISSIIAESVSSFFNSLL